MARTCKIVIFTPTTERNTTGEISPGEPIFFHAMWAERTESGGRENLYASRIVHENEVIFTIRYIKGIKPNMLIEFDGNKHQIAGVVPEGFKKTLHIKVTLRDPS